MAYICLSRICVQENIEKVNDVSIAALYGHLVGTWRIIDGANRVTDIVLPSYVLASALGFREVKLLSVRGSETHTVTLRTRWVQE